MRRKLWEFLVAEIDTAVLVRILTNSGHPFPEPRHESDKTLVFPFLLMIKYPLIQQFSLPKHFKQMFMIILHPRMMWSILVIFVSFLWWRSHSVNIRDSQSTWKCQNNMIKSMSETLGTSQGLWSNAWFSSVFHTTFQYWIFWKAMSDCVQRHSNRVAVPLLCQGIPWVLRRTLITLHCAYGSVGEFRKRGENTNTAWQKNTIIVKKLKKE